jgi:DHA2 family multidrug resistance protein
MARDKALLGEHVTMFDPMVQRFLSGAVGGMVQKGSAMTTARGQAVQLLDFSLLRQAAVLAYNHVFWLIAAMFLISVPLVLLLREAKLEPGAEMHVSE